MLFAWLRSQLLFRQEVPIERHTHLSGPVMIELLHDTIVGVLLHSPMALVTHQQVQVCNLRQQNKSLALLPDSATNYSRTVAPAPDVAAEQNPHEVLNNHAS